MMFETRSVSVFVSSKAIFHFRAAASLAWDRVSFCMQNWQIIMNELLGSTEKLMSSL
jgi:hypothetical protein